MLEDTFVGFLCVSKSTHPNILKATSVFALLCIICAALFRSRCKQLLHTTVACTCNTICDDRRKKRITSHQDISVTQQGRGGVLETFIYKVGVMKHLQKHPKGLIFPDDISYVSGTGRSKLVHTKIYHLMKTTNKGT